MSNYKSLCYIQVGTSLSEGTKKDGIHVNISYGNKIIINANQYLLGWLYKHLQGGYHLLSDSYLQWLLSFTDFWLFCLSKHCWHHSHRRKAFWSPNTFCTLFIVCMCYNALVEARKQTVEISSFFSQHVFQGLNSSCQASRPLPAESSHWLYNYSLYKLTPKGIHMPLPAVRLSKFLRCASLCLIPMLCT